jgi:hypothetical protein
LIHPGETFFEVVEPHPVAGVTVKGVAKSFLGVGEAWACGHEMNEEKEGDAEEVVAVNPEAGACFAGPVSENPAPKPAGGADADEDDQERVDGAFGEVGDAGEEANEGIDPEGIAQQSEETGDPSEGKEDEVEGFGLVVDGAWEECANAHEKECVCGGPKAPHSGQTKAKQEEETESEADVEPTTSIKEFTILGGDFLIAGGLMLRICLPCCDPWPERIDDTIGSVWERHFEGFGDAFREVWGQVGESFEGEVEIVFLVRAEDIGVRVVGLADELAGESQMDPRIKGKQENDA